MICPHCKVNIACRTEVCPLCHVKFNKSVVDSNTIRRLPRAFAPRGKVPFLSTSLFDKIYMLVALNLVVMAAAVELILSGQLKWWFILLVAVAYTYILFRSTIQAGNYFSNKVLLQAIILTLLGFTVQNAIGYGSLIIFEYLLPSVYIVSLLCEGINIIICFKSSRVHLMKLISVSLLAFMPMGVVMLGKSPLPNALLAMITAALGGCIIIMTLLVFAKKIWGELKRFFHI